MAFKLDYDDTDTLGLMQRYMQVFVSVDPSVPSGQAELSQGIVPPADEINAVTLIGPLSTDALKRLKDAGKSGYFTTEWRDPDVYIKSYYAEGVTGETAKDSIMRVTTEDPTRIDSVDLYQGKRRIRRLFPGETELWSTAKYFG